MKSTAEPVKSPKITPDVKTFKNTTTELITNNVLLTDSLPVQESLNKGFSQKEASRTEA